MGAWSITWTNTFLLRFGVVLVHAPDSFPVRVWAIPQEVRLIRKDSVLRFERRNSDLVERTLTTDLFVEFCRLADATDPRQIERFARSWGELGLKFRKRAPVHSFLVTTRSHGKFARSDVWQEGRKVVFEPVWLWRDAAASARALGRLCAALLGDQDAATERAEDWMAAVSLEGSPPPGGLGARGRDSRRDHLGTLIEDWLALGRSQFVADLSAEQRPFVGLETFGCGGAVATQFAVAIRSGRGMVVCEYPGCGLPFLPDRKYGPKQHRFCPGGHRRKGPTLLAKWMERGRPRSARKTNEVEARGRSVRVEVGEFAHGRGQ